MCICWSPCPVIPTYLQGAVRPYFIRQLSSMRCLRMHPLAAGESRLPQATFRAQPGEIEEWDSSLTFLSQF